MLAYGGVRFASKSAQLAGNHFITIVEGLENVTPLGKMCLWKGAQPIRFELMDSDAREHRGGKTDKFEANAIPS